MIHLYCTSCTDLPPRAQLLACMPPVRQARLSQTDADSGALAAYGLLDFALWRHYALSAACVQYTAADKPYLTGNPVFLSLSHTKTHALCALAPFPVGCDIESHRPISQRTAARILGADESPAAFFDYWTLKESFIKLYAPNKLPPHEITFTVKNDRAARHNAHGRLFRQIPNCTIAIAAQNPFPKPNLQLVEHKEFLIS